MNNLTFNTVKYLENHKCYWVLIRNLSNKEFKFLLNPNVKYTYFMQHYLVRSDNPVTFKDIQTDNKYLLLNCDTNIIFNTHKLLKSNVDSLSYRNLTILQTNDILPCTVVKRELKNEQFFKLLFENNVRWEFYTELHWQYDAVQFMAPTEEILLNKLTIVDTLNM